MYFNHNSQSLISNFIISATIVRESKYMLPVLTLFQSGFNWLSMTGGGGWIPPPLENNVPTELGQ